MLRSKARSADSILSVMRTGTYYFSQGPVIEDWGREENGIYFKCSPCREIHVTTYPPRGTSCYACDGENISEIFYPLKGGELYIRIECIDAAGHTAWTNPYFF